MSPPSSAEMSTFIASRRTSSCLTSSPLIGPCRVLRKHDRDFGADARAGRTVGLAVALVLHLNLAVLLDAVHVEEAEAQTLHAVRAARVVDDREPRLPGAQLARAGRVRGSRWRRPARAGSSAVGIHDTHARRWFGRRAYRRSFRPRRIGAPSDRGVAGVFCRGTETSRPSSSSKRRSRDQPAHAGDGASVPS